MVWVMGTPACGGRSGLDALALGDGTGGAASAATGGRVSAHGGRLGSSGGAPGTAVDASVAAGGSSGNASGGANASATGGGSNARDAGADRVGFRDAAVDRTTDSGRVRDAAPACDPVVVSTSPTPGAVDVQPSTAITIALRCSADATAGDLALVLSSGGHEVDGSATSASPGSMEFVPKNPLSLATTYVVDVRRGNESVYTWQFTTQDGSWHDAETVATVGSLADFVFAVSREGSGIVAYIADSTVSSRRFDVTTGLSPTTETVSSRGGNAVQELNAGIDDQKQAAVGWREYSNEPVTGGQYVIYAASQQYGSAWGSPQTIDGPARNAIPDIFEIGVSETGKRFLLWADQALQLIDIDHVSEGPFTPDPGTSSERSELAFEPGGALWVIWDTWAFSGQTLGVRRLSASGGWGDLDTLGQTSASSRCSERLAVAEDGSVMVLFPSMAQGVETLIARRFVPGSGWSDPHALDTLGENGTATMIGADIAVDSRGNGLAVWTTELTIMVGRDGGPTENHPKEELRSQRFTVSGGWAAAHENLDVQLGVPGTLPNASFAAHRSALALDEIGDGFAVVVTEGGDIRAARWLGESGWQPSVSLGNVPFQDWPSPSAAPQISVSNGGRAVAVWRNGSDLMIRRFSE